MTDRRIFATVKEAKAALDGRIATNGIKSTALASVWFSAGRVFVATAAGTGNFSREEWDAGGGPRPSIEAVDQPDGFAS